jgi:subtilisin family serine protease
VSVTDPDLIEAHAPLVCFHPDELHFPTRVEALVEGATQPLSRSDLRRRFGRPVASTTGTPRLTLGMLDDDELYNGTDIKPAKHDYLDGSADDEATERFVAYARAVDDGDAWWIQYWLFYYDNPHWLIGNHQGDWELIQLRVGPKQQPQLQAATCFQHGKPVGRSRADVELSDDGRLRVYVARGSHATYFAPADPRPFDQLSAEGVQEVMRPVLLDPSRDKWLDWVGRWGHTHWGPLLPRSPGGPAVGRDEWDDPAAVHERGLERQHEQADEESRPEAEPPDPRPYRHQVIAGERISLIAQRTAEGADPNDLWGSLAAGGLEVNVETIPGLDDVVRIEVSSGDFEHDRQTSTSFELARSIRGMGWEVEPDLHTTVFRPTRDEFGEDPSADAPGHWPIERIRAPEAWELATGAGVRVGHPDTGYVVHRELEGAMDLQGAFDLLTGSGDPVDPLEGFPPVYFPGHGTGTASVIASRRAPDTELWGAAPDAGVVPFRTCRSVVLLRGSNLLQAVGLARLARCHVISISLGGLFLGSALRRAIDRAVEEGIIVVAAAGQPFPFVVEPASYESSIGVAATTIEDKPWKVTARGDAVDISAPGVGVPRASAMGKDVARGDGTSFATALVAGAAALWQQHRGQQIRANDPAAVVPAFRAALQATANRPAGWDDSRFGAGILDAATLLGGGGDVPPIDPPDPIADRAGRLATWLSRIVGTEMAPWLRRQFGGDAEQRLLTYGTELAYLAAEDELTRIQLWQAGQAAEGASTFSLVGAERAMAPSEGPPSRLVDLASPSLTEALTEGEMRPGGASV